MKMISKLLLGGLMAAAVPAVADAAVTVRGNVAFNFDVASTQFGQFVTSTITFDEAAPTYTLTTSSTGFGGVRNGTVGGQYAAPAINANGDRDATNYLASQPNFVTLSNFGTQKYVSIYWGSIDGDMTNQTGNFLDFLDANGSVVGTISGMEVGPPANGDQGAGATNRRVTLESSTAFTALRFRTTLNAFEVDNISFLSAVPEPASWAMMVGGFGLMGAALRRKKATQLFA